MKASNRLGRILSSIWRGWRLCCPRCGEHTLFRRWFTMYEQCAVCRLKFEREQGYFLGAMYINYAMTVGIVLVGYFVLEWMTDMSLAYQLVLWGSVSVLCPLLLFRRSRGLCRFFRPGRPGRASLWPGAPAASPVRPRASWRSPRSRPP
jgi:uncharacterized protein (DUF983 family)